MKLHAYLNFDGRTEEALTFYADVLGGTLGEVHRFGSMPEDAGFPLTPEQKERVMHVGLELPDGQMLMGSDVLAGFGPPRVEGTNFSLSVHPASRADADRIFGALADGGQVTMPLEDQFWGDYFGSLIDRFGVNWMINYAAGAPS